ncbi:hypothetical protein ARMGADRAFT_1090132 [Armillaria gallica]|uniref:Uncharacterized protein n=1 Tax=Armillaria gallica TaxID=47427 RepID=A0A2H3CI16_ARMGA|nr:hypothetical protein ARMGADRAFT_1090132 [Armillaria gallica]
MELEDGGSSVTVGDTRGRRLALPQDKRVLCKERKGITLLEGGADGGEEGADTEKNTDGCVVAFQYESVHTSYQTTSSADSPLAAPSPTRFSPSSPLPESRSTIIDTFFLRLLCIAQTEREYEAVFDFVQGVYASEGAETIISVWGEPEVFMRDTWKKTRKKMMNELVYRVDMHYFTDAASASSK